MSACSICKRAILDGAPETWVTAEEQTVEISRSELPAILAETSIGEVEFCEACYRGGIPPYFTSKDAAEIHHQFGLEYRDLNERSPSVEALRAARQLDETADILAALAFAENEVGQRGLAITLYNRALEIDPEHFMARENLKNIGSHAA